MVMSLDMEKATKLITERAEQFVHTLIQERGNDKPPFLAEEFARFHDITRIIRTDLGKTSAILLKLHDGFLIKVNKKQNIARQNFSCAHEIGHILFNELKLEHYIRNIEYRKFNPQAEQKVRAAAVERLCDIAATELLMPESIFRKYLTNFGISISSIEHLANIFRVSRQSAAIRIAEVSPEPCLTLLWQPSPRNKPKGLRLVWRTGRIINWQNRVNYMPKHELVKPPSTLHKAYRANCSTKSRRKFVIDKAEKYLPIESKGFGRNETRYVISLAFLNR
jgi:hypothetical protein